MSANRSPHVRGRRAPRRETMSQSRQTHLPHPPASECLFLPSMSPSRRSTRGGLGARRRPPRRWGLWHLVLSRMAEAQACEDSGRRRPRPAPSSTRLSPKGHRPLHSVFTPGQRSCRPSICRDARDRSSGEEATTARPRSPSRSRPASESLFVTSETPPDAFDTPRPVAARREVVRWSRA